MFLLKKLTLWLGLLGLVGITLLVRRTTTTSPMPEPPIPPAIKVAQRGLAASGLVEALGENTSLGVPVAGLVAEIHVRVWDEVAAGAPLLRLDDRELQAQLRAQRAELAVHEAQLAADRRQSTRTELLRASRAVSEDEADTRRDALAIQTARVESARATLAQTETLLARLTVRAPAPGTILQVNTRPGEYLSPAATTAPLVLGRIDTVQVRADVDEQLAPRVAPGSPATGYLKGDTSRPIPLTFVRIEPYVVPKRSLTGASTERVDTRVLQIIYRFANTDPTHRLYVGQQMDLFITEPPSPAPAPAASAPRDG